MKRRSPYWQGSKPSDSGRWTYTTAAEVIDDPEQLKAVFHMHRRYVKQWNDIELDMSRGLNEHTHKVLDAQVVGASRKFILHAHNQGKDHWILEILFARGFSPFHPGWSCGKNPFRTPADMRSVRLHWSEDGKTAFHTWLQAEATKNAVNGECTEYKKKQPRLAST